MNIKACIIATAVLIMFSKLCFCQNGYNVYFGNLHSHTGYTGGVYDPAYAYKYAKDTAHIDFLAVTDHLETLSNSEWSNTLYMADQANNDGVFAAFAGYEWTSPTYNHCNVFNTTTKVSQFNVNNWQAFVQDLISNPTAIAQFNHPGFAGSNNWNNFSYIDQQADDVFCLYEINSAGQEYYYPQALDSGWHVSPAAGQDNHDATWGNLDDTRTGIWSTQLTRTALIDAIKAGRTFSTFDKNASVWLDIAGVPMGGTVNYSNSLPLHIRMNDTDLEQWKYVMVFAAGTQQLFYKENLPHNFDTIIYINPSQSKWLYVRARQMDDQYIYSAPMHISNLPNEITELGNELSVKLYPNPVTNNTKLSVKSLSSGSGLMIMRNVMGVEIFRKNIQLEPGLNEIPFNSDIKQGIYFFEIEGKDFKAIFSLVK